MGLIKGFPAPKHWFWGVRKDSLTGFFARPPVKFEVQKFFKKKKTNLQRKKEKFAQ